MTPRVSRERLNDVWRQKLHKAEKAYKLALSETTEVYADLASLPPADGNLRLAKALESQNQAMRAYEQVLQTFTRLILYGEMPEETIGRPQSAESKMPTDLDIQKWVFRSHGFVPHPTWIVHGRELYLNAATASRSPADECPPDKRLAIRDAFVALGMLRE